MIIDSEFICHFYGAIRLIGLAAKINTIGDRCHHVVVVLLVLLRTRAGGPSGRHHELRTLEFISSED